MKIAVMTYGLDGIGGIAKHVLYMSRELVRLGHEVTLWAIEFDEEKCYPDITRDLTIHALRHPGPVPFATADSRPGSRMSAYLRGLRQYERDQQALASAMPRGYDIVNPHGNAIHWAAAAYKQQHGTPSVWLCNDFWPMAYQAQAASSRVKDRAKQMLKRALVARHDALDRASVQAMDDIAVLSERVQGQMRAHYGVQTTVIRPGVTRPDGAVSRKAMRARLGFSDDTFLFMTLCMLMPRRRLEDAVRAIKQLADEGRDVGYIIAGSTAHSPSYAEAIEEEVHRLGLQGRVVLSGEVVEHELGSMYAACDGFIWPADENQSWSMASMEAMLHHKPVLVSTANGLAEVLTDEVQALLFPPRDPDHLAAQARRLMDDAGLRDSLAAQGASFVQSHYSWRSNAEAMLDLFSRAMGQRERTQHALAT